MKKIFCCLLVAGLLFSLAIVAGAESAGEVMPSEESSQTVVLVPCEEDLPDGYEVDEDFYIEISLTADGGWVGNYTWEELLKEAVDDGGDYIYFVAEDGIPEGYVALYSLVSNDLTDGNIVIIKNVKQGEPPVYELPQTGGSGTTLYTVAGSAILLIAAVSAVLLHRKRKKNEA